MRKLVKLGSCAVALLFGGWAFAQEEEIAPTPEGQVEAPSTVDPLAPCPPVEEPGIGGTGEEVMVPPAVKTKKPMARTYVTVGGGVEGYTGELAPSIDAGLGWGATLGFRALKNLGLELGYSGAVNEIDARVPDFSDVGAGDGADIVRNGGQAAALVGLGTRINPYILGGFGVEDYNIRNGELLGYSDSVHTYIPAGLGVAMYVTRNIRADLRGTYDFLLADDFAPVDGGDIFNGRYQGTLLIGGAF